MYPGIDYSTGNENVDKKTGIRFGVIPVDDLHEYIYDDLEADYGDPCCPKCGNDAKDVNDEDALDLEAEPQCDWERCRGCEDYYCEACEYIFESGEAYPEEAHGYYIDDGEYKAGTDSHRDCMIFKSPYYTYAQFCSPCAPGAGYLRNPTEYGVGAKCYCFGEEMFSEDRPCPYPYWLVNPSEVYLEGQKAAENGDKDIPPGDKGMAYAAEWLNGYNNKPDYQPKEEKVDED